MAAHSALSFPQTANSLMDHAVLCRLVFAMLLVNLTRFRGLCFIRERNTENEEQTSGPPKNKK